MAEEATLFLGRGGCTFDHAGKRDHALLDMMISALISIMTRVDGVAHEATSVCVVNSGFLLFLSIAEGMNPFLALTTY